MVDYTNINNIDYRYLPRFKSIPNETVIRVTPKEIKKRGKKCPGPAENVILTEKIKIRKRCDNQLLSITCSTPKEEKILIKGELDSSEQTSDYFLISGPLYLRKSTLNTLETKRDLQKIEEKIEPIEPYIPNPIIKNTNISNPQNSITKKNNKPKDKNPIKVSAKEEIITETVVNKPKTIPIDYTKEKPFRPLLKLINCPMNKTAKDILLRYEAAIALEEENGKENGKDTTNKCNPSIFERAVNTDLIPNCNPRCVKFKTANIVPEIIDTIKCTQNCNMYKDISNEDQKCNNKERVTPDNENLENTSFQACNYNCKRTEVIFEGQTFNAQNLFVYYHTPDHEEISPNRKCRSNCSFLKNPNPELVNCDCCNDTHEQDRRHGKILHQEKHIDMDKDKLKNSQNDCKCDPNKSNEQISQDLFAHQENLNSSEADTESPIGQQSTLQSYYKKLSIQKKSRSFDSLNLESLRDVGQNHKKDLPSGPIEESEHNLLDESSSISDIQKYEGKYENEALRICRQCFQRNTNAINAALKKEDIHEIPEKDKNNISKTEENHKISCKDTQRAVEDFINVDKNDIRECIKCCNEINCNIKEEQLEISCKDIQCGLENFDIEKNDIHECLQCCEVEENEVTNKNIQCSLEEEPIREYNCKSLEMSNSEIEFLINSYVPLKTYEFTPSECEMKKTHGEIFGDIKYHFLMVDVDTSIASIDHINPHTTRTASIRHSNDTHATNTLNIKNEDSDETLSEDYLTDYMQSTSISSSASKSNKDYCLLKNRKSQKAAFANMDQEAIRANKRLISMGSIHPSILEDMPYHTVLEKDSNETIGEGPTMETRSSLRDSFSKVGNIKRMSLVSWGESDSPPNEPEVPAIEIPTKRDTTKPTKMKSSIFEDIVMEEKRKTLEPPKNSLSNERHLLQKRDEKSKRGFFSFMHRKTKPRVSAPRIKMSRMMNQDDEDSDSGSDISIGKLENELEETSRKGSLQNYRHRHSPIENPVPERNKEINKYLDNLTYLETRPPRDDNASLKSVL